MKSGKPRPPQQPLHVNVHSASVSTLQLRACELIPCVEAEWRGACYTGGARGVNCSLVCLEGSTAVDGAAAASPARGGLMRHSSRLLPVDRSLNH